MKNLKTAMIVLALFGATALQAQTPMAPEVFKMSQYNYSLGTARSAAMGGAFVSLGADLSSMQINPAGLGLYRGSDFSYTPLITIADMNTVYTNNNRESFSASSSKTHFGTGNLSAALNIYQGGGALTSFTLGFGYNRIADFNTSSSAYAQGNSDTYGQIWGGRLGGVSVSTLQNDNAYIPYDKVGINQWGGVLGYQAGVLDPDPQYTNSYSIYGPSANYPNRTGPLSPSATVNPTQNIYSQGSAGEYNLSGGFNFSNKLYLGFGVGLQDLDYTQSNIYEETYNNNDRNLEWVRYDQVNRFRGTGVNFKFGAIVRPVDNLRIGVSIHTPTFISMQQEYQEFMGARFTNKPYGGLLDSRWITNTYKVNTPTRLMAGLSYAFPGIGLISFDYERAWYNGMRLRNTGYPDVEADFKSDVMASYQATNNYRAGLELTPTKNFFVRAGYAYYGNGIIDAENAASINTTEVKSYQNISGGLGFRFSKYFYMDMAYVYTQAKFIPTSIFYYEDAATHEVWVDSGLIQPKMTRHTILLTLGFKF